MSLIAAIIGRLLIALLFLVSGLQKVFDPGSAMAMLESVGLSPNLALVVAFFEIVTAILLAIGLMTRLVSIVLAAYVALTILFFHHDFTDPMGLVTSLMHVALIGGLLMVFAYGQMRGSYDYMRAERRAHDADVRAARAEGRAEGVMSAPHTVVTDVDADGVPEVRPRRRWF
ncbi:MAG: DoxX family protein [Altererythrobacter sp.]|nr:DoxX family protein [Altererythrobacter sp.]